MATRVWRTEQNIVWQTIMSGSKTNHDTVRTNTRVKTTSSIEEQESVKSWPEYASTSLRTQCTQCQPESVRHRRMRAHVHVHMKVYAEVTSSTCSTSTRQNLQLKVQDPSTSSGLCSAHWRNAAIKAAPHGARHSVEWQFIVQQLTSSDTK